MSSSELHSLPLFPLNTVLFPGGILPLRIFEVRYLDLIRRCSKAGAPFGVVSLTQGTEVRLPGQQEAFADVGTLALIEQLDQPQPGLMHIRVAGAQRFRILRRERLTHGLWVADVLRIPDDAYVPVPEDLRAIPDALARLATALEQRDAQAPLPMTMPLQLNDCAWVANRWCELLPMNVALKQRLLELDNPLLRLELIGDVLSRHRIGG